MLILVSYIQQIGLVVDYNLRPIGGGEFIRTVEFILVSLIQLDLIFIVPSLIKEFWFYFAKACIEVVQEEEGEVDKTVYLFLGLPI